jgi:hypothetical protein
MTKPPALSREPGDDTNYFSRLFQIGFIGPRQPGGRG